MKATITLRLAVAIGTVLGCAHAVRPVASASLPPSGTNSDWLASEPAVCGQLRGRVLDARTGAPFPDVYVSLDSAPGGVTTDSLGQFHFVITPFSQTQPTLTRNTTLRIRRIGSMELAVILRPSLAYVIEAVLAPQQLHVDGISGVRVKHPGFCERPR